MPGPALTRVGTFGGKHHGSRKKWHVATSGARLISALGKSSGSIGMAASPFPGVEGAAAGVKSVEASANLRGLDGGGSDSLVGVERGGGSVGLEAGSNGSNRRSGSLGGKDEPGGGLGRRGSGSAPGNRSRSATSNDEEGQGRKSGDLEGGSGDFVRRSISKGASLGRSRLAPASSGPTNMGHIRRQVRVLEGSWGLRFEG